MPARPIADETLHLIGAVGDALAHRSDVEERTMFGYHCFFVGGKLCIGVKGDELLVRLPPERHAEFQEMQSTRELSPGGRMLGYFCVEPNGYATRAQWAFWIDEALAYNPRAKASPRRKRAKASAAPPPPGSAKSTARNAPEPKRHSIFEADE